MTREKSDSFCEGDGLRREAPVVIGGLERSGTSLMRAILGSHPELALFQWDLPLWRHLYAEYRERTLSEPEVTELVEVIVHHRKTKNVREKPNRREVMSKIRKRKWFERSCAVTCSDVFGLYLKTYAQKRDCPRWGLKTPTNEFHAEAIFDVYPNARFVHLIRDPRDVAVSRAKTSQMPGDLSCNPFTFATMGWIGDWRTSAGLGRRHERRFESRYRVVRYEDLVARPAGVLRDLCALCDLPYREEMLRMNDHPGWDGDNSGLRTTPDEGVQNFTGRYKKHLRGDQIQFIERHLHDEMQRYGYEIAKNSLTTTETLSLSVLELNLRLEPAKLTLWYALKALARKAGVQRSPN